MVEKVADPRKVKKVDIEPNAVAIKAGESGYQTQLMRALSWYHAEQDRKDATKFARSWIKQHMPESLIGFDKARGEVTPTFGWLCRIHQRGAVLSDLHVNKIRDYMRVYAKLQANEVVVAVKATPRPRMTSSKKAKTSTSKQTSKARKYPRPMLLRSNSSSRTSFVKSLKSSKPRTRTWLKVIAISKRNIKRTMPSFWLA